MDNIFTSYNERRIPSMMKKTLSIPIGAAVAGVVSLIVVKKCKAVIKKVEKELEEEWRGTKKW